MTEPIEPDFDLAAQDARELARRATMPAQDAEQPDMEPAVDWEREVGPPPPYWHPMVTEPDGDGIEPGADPKPEDTEAP